MKKLAYLLFILFAVANLIAQPKYKLSKEIIIDKINTKKLDKIAAEFVSNKRTISKYNAININEIVDICENCFAEVETQNGTYFLSPNDLKTDRNNQQILMLFDDNFSDLGDTLVIGEDDLMKLDENELLELELGSITNVGYTLNSKDWNKKNIDKYFKPRSIIFPFDINTKRWITDVKSIKIYSK